jgi:hypothetical protein
MALWRQWSCVAELLWSNHMTMWLRLDWSYGQLVYLWEWAIASHGGLLIPPGWLQVTCVGHCSICQIKNVVKYFWHTGGVEIRSDFFIVGVWYFMWHYWALTICQELQSYQWRLHSDHVMFYRINSWPRTWQSLIDVEYPVISHKIQSKHN